MSLSEEDRAKFDAAALAVGAENLCSDCPPPGYPTDKTRCGPCPRRAALQAQERE